MIKPNTQAFDEILLCALLQGIIVPVEIGNKSYLDILDYWKIKELEW